MAEWKKVLVSGSGIHVQSITASGLTQQNTDKVVVYDSSTGIFYYTSSAGIGGGGIFIDRGTYYNTKNTLQISGSTLQSSPSASGTGTSPVSTGTNNNIYALLVSESIYSFNHNIGYPNANSWKENLQGSYFNSFDANTNVSEVLRFIAGLLSQSAPAPSPNTRTYNALGFNRSNNTTTTLTGRFPSSSINQYTTYLFSKGFFSLGSTFTASAAGFYTGDSLIYTYSSSAGGSTIISSSNDSQLFGLGEKTDIVYLSSSALFKFYSSSNEGGPATEQSSSETLVTINTANSSLGGLSRTTISTANPTVIPSLYQDGKFTSAFSSSFNPNDAFTTLSSSGWYHYSQSIGISTGSSNNFVFRSNNQRVFRTPPNIGSLIGLNTINHSLITSPLTATSRSLSGAPYLSQSTYSYTCTSSGLFNPLYSVTNIYLTTTGSSFITLTTPISLSLNSTDGTISTSNLVYSSSVSSVARNTGVVPSEQDVVKVSSTTTFAPTAGATNITQTGLTGTLTSSSIAVSGSNRSGTYTVSSSNLVYFTAGTFGQPAASGTMAYYNRAQGYDDDSFSRTNAGILSASFRGESKRLQLDDNVLSGSYSLGTAWSTAFGLYNLGTKDLQVKPNYLVRPGGTYKYWLNDPGPSEDYKYYAVGFTRDISTNQPSISMSLAGNTTLVEWTDTTTNNSIAALIIPQSVLGSSTQATGIDPKATSDTNAIAANTAGTNPFGRTLTILTNTNSQKINPFVINFPTVPAYPLNSTYKNFVLLLRYKGDPTPLTSVTFTITS